MRQTSQPTPHLALSGAIGPLDRDERPGSHGYTRRPLRKLLPKDRGRLATLPCLAVGSTPSSVPGDPDGQRCPAYVCVAALQSYMRVSHAV